MNKYREIIEDIDILDELEKRGVTLGRKLRDNQMICCPFHGERTPSFGIAFQGPNKGRFQCFGCHETGNFFHLVAQLDGIKFVDAVRKFDKGFDVDDDTIGELRNQFLTFLKSEEENKNGKIKILDPSIMRFFKKPYGKFIDYLMGNKRKLNKESIKKWNILCYDEDHGDEEPLLKGWGKDRVVLPMQDRKGRLICIMGRSIYDVDKSEKVRKRGERKKILFGLSFIERGTTLVLVEGEFDAIYLQQFGIPAVSIGTTTIGDIQIQKIVKFSDHAALSLDGDTYKIFNKDGVNIRKEVYDKLSRFISVDVLQLPRTKDPNELSPEEVKKIYSKYAGGIIEN